MNLIEKLKGLNITIQTIFKTTKKEVKDPLQGVLYDITPVNGPVTNIVAVASVPGMKEFKSERKHGVAEDTVHTIAPRKWEATLDVKHEDIEDDNLGQVPAKVRRMATTSGKHYGALALKALKLGFTAQLSDGKAFFHNDRGNLIAGALTAENFEKAIDTLISMKDGDGNPINPEPTHLIVGVANRAVAEAIISKRTLASGEDNTNYKRVDLIVDPRVDGKMWAVIAAKEGIAPLTIAERIKVSKPVAKNDLNSDRAFETDVFSWGLRGRYDAAYQESQFIVASKGA